MRMLVWIETAAAVIIYLTLTGGGEENHPTAVTVEIDNCFPIDSRLYQWDGCQAYVYIWQTRQNFESLGYRDREGSPTNVYI